MNTAGLLDMVFYLYKKTFWRQMVRAMVFGIPAYIFLIIFSFFGVMFFGAAGIGGVSAAVFASVFVVLFLIWATLGAAGNTSLTKQAFYGNNVSIDIMFKDIKNGFFSVFTSLAAVFLLALPLLAAAVLFFVRVFRYFFERPYNADASIVFIICIIVVIVLAVYFISAIFFTATSAVVPAAAIEKKYFFSAVARSFMLVKNDFKKIFGTYLIWRLIVGLINYSALIAYYIATGSVSAVINNLTDFYSMSSLTYLLGNNFVYILISLILSPFDAILAATVYFNQRIKNEGFDIEIGLEKLAEREQAAKSYASAI